MRKHALWCILLAIMLLYGCSQRQNASQPPSYEYVIGVSQANLIEPWRIAQYEEMRAQGENYENTRIIFTDAASDYKRQIADLEHLLQLGIDILIISPNNADELRDVISKVHQSIPVILLDRYVDGGDYDLFIGSDNRSIGMLAGSYISKLLGETGGNVLEITGNQNSPPAQELSKGFAEALVQNPQIHVVSTLDGNWLRDTAEMRMKDFLIKSEKVDVVFAHNDAMAYGAYIAAKELWIKDIRFIGVDGLDNEGKRLVETGVLAGTFFRHTGGKEAIDYAWRILQKDSNVPKQILLEPVQITAEP